MRGEILLRPGSILHRHLSSSTALGLAFAVLGSPALAGDLLPTGGQVVFGSAAIATSDTSMTITQNSDRAIVNWSDFSIGQGNSVNFMQPNSSSAILNRVTGNTTSTIAGSLTGNGQVFLINPNGIAITPTGSVKVGGGFVASTLDISNDDFLKGQYRFNGNAASSSVSNEGVITVGRGGYAALIGGTVKNDGLIAVPMGKVGLGSGEQATLDLSGDGFLQVAVPTRDGAEGKGALVENGGAISADGGTVVMRAATARNAARHAINLSGVVEAKSVSGSNGSITIGGGQGGRVTVSGKVRATSATGKGGKVTVTGKSIALKGATLDVSGAKGGGTVRIGGDRQGKGSTQRAETTSIDANSTIKADATESGNGGSVVVWSDNLTSFSGLITAMGADSGTGGDAEVSGKTLIDYTGFTNLSGSGGFGTLLLDPYNITISNSTASNSSGTSATGNDSVINVTTLATALSAANVTVTTGAADSAGSQAGNITVADAVSWTSGSTLTMSAYGTIAVNANLTGGSGSSIVLRADNSGTGIGTVTFGTGVKATASSGVSIYYNPTGNDNTSVNGTSYTSPNNYAANTGVGTGITASMLINTVYDLQNIQNNLSGIYAMGNDIDASGTATWNGGAGFNPVGSGKVETTGLNAEFNGQFDGLSHTITGLIINRPSTDYVGLFGSSDGAIRNLNVIGGSVTGRNYVGGLVGFADYDSSIRNSHTAQAVTGTSDVGGLVGHSRMGWNMTVSTIDASSADGSVRGGSFIGGLVGSNELGGIGGSYATGNVTGISDVGGLVGSNSDTINNSYATGAVTDRGGDSVRIGGLVGSIWNSGLVSNSYATGTVTGYNGVGGLVGYIANYGDISISRSYATGNVESRSSYAGGLVGYNSSGSISDSYATGTVRGADYVGGLVGYLKAGSISNSFADGAVTGGGSRFYVGGLVGYVDLGTISNAYATGAVSGTYDVGGLVGKNAGGTVSNVYATASISGYDKVGGLVGENSGTISNAYANGAVYGQGTGNFYVGQLIGLNQGTITTSFFNSPRDQTSGQGNGTSLGMTYLSTAQMQDPFSFINAGWDFTSIWGKSTTAANDGNMMLRSLSTGLYDDYIALSGDTSKTYGDANPVLSGLTVTGIGTSNVTLNWAQTDVGVYSHSSGNVLTVNDQPGRTAYIDYGTGSLTVRPRPITIAADAKAMSYGDSIPALTYSVGGSGLVNGDSLTGALVTAASSTSAVGSYAIGQGTLSASGNYAVTYVPGQLTVTPATLTVTSGSGTIIYGDAVPDLSYTVSGWKNGQGNSLLNGVSVTSDVTSASNVGNHSTFASGGTLSGSAEGNYILAYINGQLTVTPRPITITADTKSMIYGDGVPNLTYSIGGSGLANGDVLSGALSAAVTSSSNIGSYAIEQGSLAASSNYAATYMPGQLTVTPRPITITADTKSMIYGDGVPNLTYSIGGSGLANGDVLSGALSAAVTSSSNIGSYAIEQGSLAASSNYAATYMPGQLTVAPATLTVTADNGSMLRYTELPQLGYSVSGWKNGQKNDLLIGVTVSTDATRNSPYGTGYKSVVSGGVLSGPASGNYVLAYIDGRFSVLAAPSVVNPVTTSPASFDQSPGQLTAVSIINPQGWVPGTVTVNGWDPAVNLLLTQDPKLVGAVCKVAPNFSVAC